MTIYFGDNSTIATAPTAGDSANDNNVQTYVLANDAAISTTYSNVMGWGAIAKAATYNVVVFSQINFKHYVKHDGDDSGATGSVDVHFKLMRRLGSSGSASNLSEVVLDNLITDEIVPGSVGNNPFADYIDSHAGISCPDVGFTSTAGTLQYAIYGKIFNRSGNGGSYNNMSNRGVIKKGSSIIMLEY